MTTTEPRRIVFLDTETTELRDDREVWEIGYVTRLADCTLDTEGAIIIVDCDFTWANPHSLRIGRAYQRHPRLNGGEYEDGVQYMSQAEAAHALEALVRDSIIVGIVPDFDTNGGKALLHRHGLPWAGHYHIHDAETLVAGYLFGRAAYAEAEIKPLGPPPWTSEQLSRAIGVEPPGPEARHTALGDARWCRDLWDAVAMG